MPEAGRFFISLGLNGAEKTLSGLSQVNDHFGGLKTLSTEAKLAILAALAGLEQLVSIGGKFGSQMTMMHEHLNVSIQDLQKYGNAAKIAGSSTQSMYTAFGNIQDALESLRLEGKAAPFFPALMGLIQQSGQNVSQDEILKMGNTKGGDVKFFNLLRGMINNSKINQYDLYKMISDNGMLPTDIYDAVKMGGGKTFKNALSMAPTVSDQNIAKLQGVNMRWEQTVVRFETAAMNLASSQVISNLVDALDNFAGASNKLVLKLNSWTGDMDVLKSNESPDKKRSMDAIFYKMHPDIAKIMGVRVTNQFHLVFTDKKDPSNSSKKVMNALKNGGFDTQASQAAVTTGGS